MRLLFASAPAAFVASNALRGSGVVGALASNKHDTARTHATRHNHSNKNDDDDDDDADDNNNNNSNNNNSNN